MPQLEALPAEIFGHIAQHVASSASLAPFAAASKQCQIHVEGLQFRSVRIKRSTLPDFVRIVNSRRFLALRALVYEVDAIGTGPGADGAFRISREQLHAYSDAFTTAIADLLAALQRRTNGLSEKHPGIALWLDCSTPFWNETDEDRWVYIADEEGQDRSYERACVTLMEQNVPTDLVVPTVTAFRHQNNYLRQILWPSSWSALLARFPNLRTAHLEVFDNERKGPGSRLQARTAFAATLSSLPPQLTELTLSYKGVQPTNELLSPPRLTDPSRDHDIFSRALGSFSQQLTKLDLHLAVLNLEDFFNSCAPDSSSNLQELNLQWQQLASADGTWYFDLDPRMTMDEFLENETDPDAETLDDMREYMGEDELPAPMDVPLLPFRTTANPDNIKKIYVAAAEAVKRMSKLRLLDLHFQILGQTNLGIGEHAFRFVHGEDPWLKTSTAAIKAVWEVLPAFVVEPEVVRAWKSVGAVRGVSIELYHGEPSVGMELQLLE